MVDDALDLDAESLAALEQGLAEAGFVIEIVAIHRLLEEVEIYVWEVDTRQGRSTLSDQARRLAAIDAGRRSVDSRRGGRSLFRPGSRDPGRAQSAVALGVHGLIRASAMAQPGGPRRARVSSRDR